MGVLREDIDNILKQDINWDKLRKSNVLITGAGGMLGSYMMKTLIVLNEEKSFDMNIYVLVRGENRIPPEFRKKVNIIVQSVIQPVDCDVPFDFVIHTASPASPKIMKDDPVGTVAANAIGTYYTLEAAKRGSGKGYLFISSREIYGQPYENQKIFTEETYGFVDPLDARSCYPEGKKVAETMCACYRAQYGIDAKIARLAHTFGPGMSLDDGRVQADFLRNLVNDEDIVLKSDGSAIRTYTYVGDAVAALFYILLNGTETVYNISSEADTVSIKGLAEAMVKAYPEKNLQLKFEIPKSKSNNGSAPFTLGVLNSDKLKKLGWKPKYSLIEGIRRTVEFLREQ
ncbi:MAG: NAD-dependent epimerase/dehydratase family protein [[Eubacterium] brachy]|jgi:putative nucleotide sugar dehydratase|nr:NAD dependent epimerase/dehydratase family protein [Eubacterium brachy ATCC 33089]MBF1134318.1 NAD-dependent epimerase/dehydratase family protein [[Eubacterium] brachy]